MMIETTKPMLLFVALLIGAVAATGPISGKLVNTLSRKCVDCMLGLPGVGVKVQSWNCHKDSNQDFTFFPVDNDFYQIVSRSSGRCLTLLESKMDENSPIKQGLCDKTKPESLWKVSGKGDKRQIKSKLSGKCMSIKDSKDGTALVQTTCGKNDDSDKEKKDKFKITAELKEKDKDSDVGIGGKIELIRDDFKDDKRLCPTPVSEKPGAKLFQKKCKDIKSDFEIVKKGKEGECQIRNTVSNMCLGPDKDSKKRKANIVQLPCSDSKDLLWKFTGDDKDNKREIKNVGSKKCMNVLNDRLVQFRCNAGKDKDDDDDEDEEDDDDRKIKPALWKVAAQLPGKAAPKKEETPVSLRPWEKNKIFEEEKKKANKKNTSDKKVKGSSNRKKDDEKEEDEKKSGNGRTDDEKKDDDDKKGLAKGLGKSRDKFNMKKGVRVPDADDIKDLILEAAKGSSFDEVIEKCAKKCDERDDCVAFTAMDTDFIKGRGPLCLPKQKVSKEEKVTDADKASKCVTGTKKSKSNNGKKDDDEKGDDKKKMNNGKKDDDKKDDDKKDDDKTINGIGKAIGKRSDKFNMKKGVRVPDVDDIKELISESPKGGIFDEEIEKCAKKCDDRADCVAFTVVDADFIMGRGPMCFPKKKVSKEEKVTDADKASKCVTGTKKSKSNNGKKDDDKRGMDIGKKDDDKKDDDDDDDDKKDDDDDDKKKMNNRKKDDDDDDDDKKKMNNRKKDDEDKDDDDDKKKMNNRTKDDDKTKTNKGKSRDKFNLKKGVRAPDVDDIPELIFELPGNVTFDDAIEECAKKCDARTDCKAFTAVDKGYINGRGAMCFPKKKVSKEEQVVSKVKADKCVTGRKKD